jgi:hypothetical protein
MIKNNDNATCEPGITLAGQATNHMPSGLLLLAMCLSWMVVDTAMAQGPLRRIGDRIRERSSGPLAPGIDSPAPAPPQTAAPPQPRRPLLGRQDAPGPNPNPPIDGRQQPTARSANYNRAAARTGTNVTNVPAPLVRQSSALEPQTDIRSGVNGRSDGPGQAPQPGVPQPGFSQVSTANGAIAEHGNRARLGVVVDTPPTIAPVGLPPRRPRGAMVSEVQPDSAAAVAGVVVGDLIVGIDGSVITSVRDLTEQLNRYEPGDDIQLQFVRDDQLMIADISLAGVDGVAARPRPNAAPRLPGTASPSIVSGLGAAIGGLFGGPPVRQPDRQPDRQPEPPAPAPAANLNNQSPTLSAEAVRNSLPETLPAPIAEKDDP